MGEILDYQSRGPDRKVWPILLISLGAAAVVALMVLAMAAYCTRPPTARRSSGPTVMGNLKTALGVFETDNGRFPTSAEGIGALLTCPPGLRATWLGPYLEKMPLDQWGHPFFYQCPGTKDPASYDLISAGPDGVLGTADDIDKNDVY